MGTEYWHQKKFELRVKMLVVTDKLFLLMKDIHLVFNKYWA